MHAFEPVSFTYLEICARIRLPADQQPPMPPGPLLSRGPATTGYGTATSIVHDNLANEVMPSPGW